MNKSVPIAAAGLAALLIAGSAATGATVANAADGKGDAPRVPVKRAQVSQCSGGSTIEMSSRAMDYQGVAAGATADVEGSLWNVRGPKKGKDTVLVTLSSLAITGGTGEIDYVSLYRDGVATSEGQKYYGYGSAPATVQFCTKIGKGQHSLVLKVQDPGGGSTSLYNPTITYQRFN
jgi:hypothetical protein